MNFENIEQNFEKGCNVHLIIHLMRHGKKNPDGTLSKIGGKEAEERGEKMGPINNAKAYTSPVPRVIDTATSVQKGAEINNEFKQRKREQLSASLLRAPGATKPSSFFKKVVLKRLAKANNEPMCVREQKIREAEHQNMQEWLDYGDTLIDSTTNSPKNVARAVAHLLLRQIDMTERLKSGSDVDFLDVTHEFMLAAIIKYAVSKKNNDGTIVNGTEIMKSKQSIDYLESLDIEVQTDSGGKKTVLLTINNELYDIDMDSLRALANEYKKTSKQSQKES